MFSTVATSSRPKQRLSYQEVYSDSADEGTTYEINPFIVVKYKTEKNTKFNVHYVGIIQKENETGSVEVKFMRKSGTNLFIFPSKDDTVLKRWISKTLWTNCNHLFLLITEDTTNLMMNYSCLKT